MMRVPTAARLKLPALRVPRERPLTGGWIAALSIVLVTSLIWFPWATCPIGWLPPPRDAGSLLGPLLGAQAAIAALTLAVTLFVMQSISNRPDASDRGYREYIRRSWVRPIFWSSIVAVGTTALALLAEELGSGAPVVGSAPGLRNLPLVAAAAFGFNLLLAGALFEQAIHLARPSQWNALRRWVNERDVRDAVQAFLDRYRRLIAQRKADEPNWDDLFPGSDEGSADEAVRAVLDDALRAMDERRRKDFTDSLKSIEELVAHAMDELEQVMDEIDPTGDKWSPPGDQPQWPPLSELGRNLYSFREAVIRRDNRDYISDLLSLDYWLRRRAVDNRCGELFTVALGGDRSNYEIATRAGNPELREMFRDRTWLVADLTLSALGAEEAFPYARHLVRHQEQLLSDAMHADRRTDYEEFARGFDSFLRMTRRDWKVDDWPPPDSAELYEQLEQQYRIALIGLGGRAVLLAAAGKLPDPIPYLDVARTRYGSPQQLADDIAATLTREDRGRWSLWADWDAEGAQPFEVRSIDSARYPMTFFSVRLLELATSPIPDLDLHGHAKQVLDWFTANSIGLEDHVRDDPDTSMEDRRERVIGTLRDAVRRDDVAEDENIIQRELSPERIAVFTAGVYVSAFTANAVEWLFARAGAFNYLPSDTENGPGLRGANNLVGKGSLAEAPEHARIAYGQLGGGSRGRMLADGVLQDLCNALVDAPAMAAPLDSAQELLRAVDGVLENLNPQGEVILLLAGDWFNVLSELARQAPDGYQHARQIPEADRCGETGRYLGHPIIRGPHDGNRRLYVVEPGAWGCFMRAQVDGDQDLLVEVDAVTLERARELLSTNPDHFPDEPDEASKLRKLQTFVRVGAAARTGFRITDPSRARRVIDS